MFNSDVKRYFGIDFGTTNCAAVCYTVMGSKIESVFCGDYEGRPIPSVIAINKEDGTVYTGRDAWERRQELLEECEYISSIKSLLNENWTKIIAGKKWNPELVATEIFKGLKKNIQEQLGKDIGVIEAVVAIPIGLDAGKRDVIRKAALNAGIEIKGFINESTAAFFANYKQVKNDNVVVIFDWGGGTLDVSVLKHQEGKVYELATGGRAIAGDAIDEIIARKAHEKIARKKKISLSYDDMPAINKDMMLVRAERAKIAFCDDDTTKISLNNYGEFGVVKVNLNYDWFMEIIESEVDDAIEFLEKIIEESKVGIRNIERIIMVGGSSNLKPLLEKLEVKKFKDKLFSPEETMWNVGSGAAMLAATPGVYYSNQKLGIRLSDDSLFTLLPKDTLIKDWKLKEHFGIVDSNKEARFIFAGSSDLENDDNRFCTLEVPAYRFLQEQIIVDAYVDENLVFNVKAASSMRPKEYSRHWKYEKLKCCYCLPKDGGFFE